MFKPKQPKLSVVIPAYNEQDYIGRTLKSLKEQSFRNFEVIVVDNNSTDQTASIAKAAGARVLSEKQPGVCPARQTGTKAAKGAIVVSTDADTTFPKQWLTRIDAVFAANPTATLVAGPFEFVDPPKTIAKIYELAVKASKKFYERTGRIFDAGACNLAFRKTAWEKIGGYNTKLTQGGDQIDFIRRLQPLGPQVALFDNRVKTSSRRANRGTFYSLVITMGLYYFADYFIGRLVGRSLLGSYKPIRTEQPSKLVKFGFYSLYLLGFLLLPYAVVTHTALARTAQVQRVARDIHRLRTDVHIPRRHRVQ